MGCVRKRRGKWVADYRDILGVRRWVSCDTKREAEVALAAAVQQARQATRPVVDPDITIAAYSERWLTQIAPTIKPRSLDGYRQKLKLHLLPAFGHLKVRQLDRGRIKALLAEKLTSGLSPDSVRLIHATVRAMLNAAVDDGIVLANAADKLGKVLRLGRSKSLRQEQIKALDRERLACFLDATAQTVSRLYPLFFTLARTGLRLGEALALQWQDLDLERREIRVSRALSTTGEIGTPKSGRGRTVDMSAGLCALLEHHHAAAHAAHLARSLEPGERRGQLAPWVFASEAGTPLDHANVAKAFKRVLKAAHLPLHHSPHDLRHTFASLLLQQGESPVYVQRQLGHASIQLTVDTYGRWLPMGNKAAVDRLDEGLLPRGGGSGSKMVADPPLAPLESSEVIDFIGAPGPTRTANLQIRRKFSRNFVKPAETGVAAFLLDNTALDGFKSILMVARSSAFLQPQCNPRTTNRFLRAADRFRGKNKCLLQP